MENNKYKFKVVFLGDMGTGKTSLIRRYVKGEFTFNYKATIGVDFATRVVELENGDCVVLEMWDIAGQERYGSLMSVYCRGAHGAVYVFDCERPETLHNIPKWKKSFEDKSNRLRLPSILCGNKCDLEKKYIEATLDLIVREQELGGGAYFPTSAKENVGIDLALLELVHRMVETFPEAGKPITQDDTVQLDFTTIGPDSLEVGQETKKGGCC